MISLESVNQTKSLSIREIIKLDSIGNGQGYIKCGCLKGKCDNCTCKKKGLLCNSRCHGREANQNCTNLENCTN